jgi:hypothetical protein
MACRFEGAVHAFMGAVFLGAAGVDALVDDVEAHPPDVEEGEPVNGLGREGDAVVGPNGAGQAVVAEGALEDGARGHRLGGEQAVAGEQEARAAYQR